MIYINFKGAQGVETVDEFKSRKEALKMLSEYNLAFGGGCYISSRATKDYTNKAA